MLKALKAWVRPGRPSPQLSHALDDLAALPPLDALEYLPRWLTSEAGLLTQPDQLAHALAALDPLMRAHYARAMADLVAGVPSPTRLTAFLQVASPCAQLLFDRYRDCVATFSTRTPQPGATWPPHAGVLAWGTRWLELEVIAHRAVPAAFWTDLYAAVPDVAHAQLPAAMQPAARLELARFFLIVTALIADQDAMRVALLDRLADLLASRVHLRPAPHGSVCYQLDCTVPRAPQRINPHLPPTLGQSVVYADFDPLIVASNELQRQLVVHGELPRPLNPDGTQQLAEVLAALPHLHDAWCGQRPVRRHKRQDLDQNVDLVCGLTHIGKKLTNAGRTMLGLQHQDAEHGRITDVSQGGMGIVLEQGEAVRIGQAVALRVASGAHWVVGVVRRKLDQEQRRAEIGVEVLAVAPELARLQPDPTEAGPANPYVTRPPSGEANVLTVWLPPSALNGQQAALLVSRREDLREGSVYGLAAGNLRTRIRVVELAERGEGFFRFLVRVLDSD